MWLFVVVACLTLQYANTEELTEKRHRNPERFMNISEIIGYWGYPSERYEILTADGYYLQANRIPYGVHSAGKMGYRPAVLLVHPVLTEGRSWITNLPNNSLAFFLADAGYDVWILNCRGTTWSRRHQYLSIDEQPFWDFSLHELGIYDVPATIDFILQKTKQDALYYVGHSQGATIGLIAFSALPQLAQKVKLFFTFSPGYTLTNMQGLLKPLLLLPVPVMQVIWGKKEFRLYSDLTKVTAAAFCSYTVFVPFCLQGIFKIIGFNENLNGSRLDVYGGLYPDFMSVKMGIHWSQIVKSNQFKNFDYGSRNEEVYNMTVPPFYNIEDMLVPTAVWYGGADIIVQKEDVELLLPRIPHLVFKKIIPSWNHLDFIWGLDAPKQLYRDVLFLLQQYK